MARIDVTRIEGFAELNRKLKRLDDSVKRKEVLGLLRKLGRPAVLAYRGQLPEASGTIKRSVGIKTVPRRKSGGNPAVAIAPGRRGKHDAYYRHMIIRKGDRPGSTRRGSRKGLNTVVQKARDRALTNINGEIVKKAEIAASRLVQKKIDKLSRV